MVSQSSQGALAVQGVLDRSLELAGGTGDRLLQRRGLMRNGGGLAPLKSNFHHAAFVVLSSLVAVHVTEVDFHARDPIAKSVKGLLHHTFNLGGELLAPFDVLSVLISICILASVAFSVP